MDPIMHLRGGNGHSCPAKETDDSVWQRLPGEMEGAAFVFLAIEFPAPLAIDGRPGAMVRAVVADDVLGAVGPVQKDVFVHVGRAVDLAEAQAVDRLSGARFRSSRIIIGESEKTHEEDFLLHMASVRPVDDGVRRFGAGHR